MRSQVKRGLEDHLVAPTLSAVVALCASHAGALSALRALARRSRDRTHTEIHTSATGCDVGVTPKLVWCFWGFGLEERRRKGGHASQAAGDPFVKTGPTRLRWCGVKSMNKGLISEDRSNKTTLLLTIPCSLLSRLQRI
jgi:hypothetical protein